MSSVYTILPTDDMIEYTGTSAVTFSLPSVADSASIPVGKQFFITVVNNGGQVSFDATSPEFISKATNTIYAQSSGTIIHWGNGRYALMSGF